MTTTFTTTSTAVAATDFGSTARPLWRPALVSGAVAAVATTAVATVAAAAGVSFESAPGSAIPLPGFAQLTLVGAALGLLIAHLSRRRARPRAAFVRLTVMLALLSLVPDVAMSFDAASTVVLVLAHVVAAAIVIPTLARCLPDRRPA